MRYLMFVGMVGLLSGCGVIKGHSNWFVDKGIKTVDSLYVHDNPAEEKIEDMIEGVTGLDIDFSPATPEEE